VRACGWVVPDGVWTVVRSPQHDPNPEFAKENGSCQNFVEKLVEGSAKIVKTNLGERFVKK